MLSLNAEPVGISCSRVASRGNEWQTAGVPIVLRRTTPRAKAAAGRMSGLGIPGLKYLGQANVTMERIAPLRKLLSEKDRKQLREDISLDPAWMRSFLLAVAEVKECA